MTRLPAAIAALVLGLGVAAPLAAPAHADRPAAGDRIEAVHRTTAQPPAHRPVAHRWADRAVDDAVAPMSYPGLPQVSARAAAVPARAHILVMRVFWSPSPPKFPDTGQTKALMKDTARWFARTSRGRHHVDSKVTPWLRVPGGGSNCGDLYGSTRRAVAAAKAHGTGPGGFNRYMIVMPQCGTNSQGEMPGRVTWIRERQPHLDVLTHELGHNLGLDHANSLICRADKRRVTQGGKCSSQEYGDLWDAMGLSSRPYSVPVLQRLGWAGRTAATTKTGRWTLRDAEASGKGIQALRVKVSRTVSYWLEYHTTDVSNAKEPGSFAITGTPGLQVRLDTGQRSLRLLDAAPGNPDDFLSFPDPDLVNPTLPVGSSFTTPQHVRITLVSQDASSAEVRVAFGRRAGVPDAPTLVSAVATGGSGRQAQLSIQPGASDNGQVVLGYLATRYPGGQSTFVPSPGGRRTSLTVDYTGTAAQDWTVRAVNQVGASAESGRVQEHVPAPVVRILAPTAGAAVPGPNVHVVVDAQPDALSGSPVTSVTICVDDGDCVSDRAAPWEGDVVTGDGAHVVRATAYDADGREGTASTTVTVVPAPPSVRVDAPTDGTSVPSGTTFTVAATATPNPATGRAVERVTFTVYVEGSSGTWEYAEDDASPWSADFTLDATDAPVTYRIEVVARDATYSSAPAVVHVTVTP